ncbi:MAG TPA: hypothetical protein VEV42_08905 [Pyrinomonadaceae bacterium]|nr:hypothetical protein [Pyrinomonadaceae bacterium]
MTSYLTTPIPATAENNWADIANRINEFRLRFYQAQLYLPDHPAVTLVEDFMNHRNPRRLDISDKDTLTTDASAYLYDVRRMDEVKIMLAAFKKIGSKATKGLPIPFARSLGAQSIGEQLKYPFQFTGELYTNTTRALLGSYDGTATPTEIGAGNMILSFEIHNPLTWESLTRFPPILGGYEGGNSYVPHIPGWEIQMTFQWREVITLKK